MATAFIGLGSNQGDREATLDRACKELNRFPGTRLVRRSPTIETAPVEAEGGPFLNGVAEIQTFQPPMSLMAGLMNIEKLFGRIRPSVRTEPLSPARLLDLDLLWYAGMTLSQPGLEIPHPRMRGRRFVLEPLYALAPRLRDPVTGRPYAEFLQEL
ncbi:MAG: 2-amino-4-hydroxy-6-hydroxymethyldihydropteridine diphosphokinase [Nitrospirae bacterium]|nr:2-amino-4-hydroxy-6-hydroxymethyldihydropteridine diphosphokinase [Nitrospirota bacterium]